MRSNDELSFRTRHAACLDAFAGQVSLGEYLLLDDHTLTEFAKACTRTSDQVLPELSGGLLNRRLFKAIDVTDQLGPGLPKFTERAKEIILKAGLDTDYAFEYDAPSDTAYKLYNPDAEQPATQIYIANATGKQVELSECTESVHHLTKRYKLVRYYFPADVRGQIETDARPLLTKE